MRERLKLAGEIPALLDGVRRLAYSGRVIRLVLLMLGPLALVGCQSERWGPYTRPGISGQILVADTKNPVAGAMVSRGGRQPIDKTGLPPKGGELMIRKMPVRTDHNGRFVLQGERVLSIFRGSGWSLLYLWIEKPGFVTIETNFPISLATNLPEGATTLDVGQIPFQPISR